jgi:hypothetical protein
MCTYVCDYVHKYTHIHTHTSFSAFLSGPILPSFIHKIFYFLFPILELTFIFSPFCLRVCVSPISALEYLDKC